MNNIVTCPHCKEYVEILELNCRIFRHGIYKNNNQQMNPHASKEECEYLIDNNLIYGCGKPFMIEMIDNTYNPFICDYI
jgi:hypothetical protein